MSKHKQIEFRVVMKYDSVDNQPIDVKGWWARQLLENAIQESLDRDPNNTMIDGVEISIGCVYSIVLKG